MSNVTYYGKINTAIGSFTTGINPTNLGIASGIVLSSGDVNDLPGQNISGNMTMSNGYGSDPYMQYLSSYYVLSDVSIIGFDFVANADTIQLKYVFGSEEYHEWVGQQFNDVTGIFLSGPGINGPIGNDHSINIATVPDTTLPISVNTINANLNTPYFVNNIGGATIELDGFTTVLCAKHAIVPGMTYHMRIGIADGGDQAYDCGLFVEGGSLAAIGNQALNTSVEYSIPNDSIAYKGCSEAILNFSVSSADTNDRQICVQLAGGAQLGTDYTLSDTCVTIYAGDTSAGIVITPVITPGNQGIENIIFIYEIVPGVFDSVEVFINDYNEILISLIPDTICPGDSILVNPNVNGGSGYYAYLWNNGSQQQFYQSGTLFLPENWLYLTITDTACNIQNISKSDSVNIIVFAPLNLFIGNDTTICNNENLFINVDSGYYTYLWNTQDTTAGILVSGSQYGLGTFDFWVTVTDSNSCAETDSIMVNIIDCTGIYEHGCIDFQVYPNPAQSYLIINKKNSYNTPCAVIYNTQGAIIKSIVLEGESTNVDISAYSEGVYFICIQGEKLETRNYYFVKF